MTGERGAAEEQESDGRQPQAGEQEALVRHLRPRDGGEQQTTTAELLFDLVYVIAITQISHLVITHRIGMLAVGHAAFVLLVVWWAWIYTTWLVNWFDPGTVVVRLVLIFAGLASLVMSVALPDAFTTDATVFAGAYVALQVGRNVAATLLLPKPHALRRVFERITAWSLLCAPFWIVGALDSSLRIELWALALLIDLIAPAVGYATPGLGRSQTTDWMIEGSHFAERFQAFIIIALGESIAVTGTAASGTLHGARLVALAVAFLETGALWWMYFGEVAERSRAFLASSDDAGRLGRDAYTYLHLPIVAGIIMVAVADHTLISDPTGTVNSATLAMLVGGPVLYMIGQLLFRLRMIGWVTRKRVVAVVVIAATVALGRTLSAITLTALLTAWMTILAAAEHEPLRASLARALGLAGPASDQPTGDPV